MSAPRPLQSILIVGGGTAGWMAACYLATQLRATGRRVTLIESAVIPTIGVGEATVPPLVGYLRVLGLSEEEFMRRAHATYKVGIKFVGWRNGADAFWHPFGPVGGNIDGLPLFHYWLKGARAGHDPRPYTGYSLQALLGEQERAPRGASATTLIYDRGQYAYHLDAGAFAAYLREEALRRGAVRIEDEVTGVALDARGHIERIDTRAHGALRADLYLDCTGFQALLAERALGDRYVDWSDLLFCDRALAAPLPLAGAMPPYTRATALSAGWVWQIPLAHRAGNGYVYSSRHLSEDDAAREFAGLLGADADALQPRTLRMRVGRRSRSWIANCIAVGLASGFIEPLESTGIFLIQRSLALLLTYFPDTAFEPHLARRYNERMAATYDEIRDFILAHYVLSERADSAFWRDVRALALPDSLRELFERYERTGIVETQEYAMFPSPSWYCILVGMGRLPRTHHAGAELSDYGKVRAILADILAANERVARDLPAHADYVAALHRAEVEQRAPRAGAAADAAARVGIG
jgi:tryptophan halogenase